MAHFSEWLLVGYSSRPGHSIPIKFYANILFSFFSHFWIKSVCYLTARFKNSFLQQIEDVGRCIVHLVWELIQHWHWHRGDRLSGCWIRLAMNICWGDHCIGGRRRVQSEHTFWHKYLILCLMDISMESFTFCRLQHPWVLIIDFLNWMAQNSLWDPNLNIMFNYS